MAPRKPPEVVRPLKERVDDAIAWLRSHATKATRDGMARYNVPSDKAFGVSMKNSQLLAKQLGRDHALAAALWETGWYEARMLTAFVAWLLSHAMASSTRSLRGRTTSGVFLGAIVKPHHMPSAVPPCRSCSS